jgi:hypothetical protein
LLLLLLIILLTLDGVNIAALVEVQSDMVSLSSATEGGALLLLEPPPPLLLLKDLQFLFPPPFSPLESTYSSPTKESAG